jgi:hypothetical protein
MISTLFRRFVGLVLNLVIFGALVGSFYVAEKWLELVECTGHDMKDRMFWEFRSKEDFFYIALFFAANVGFLYLADWFRDGSLKVWHILFGHDDPPNAPPKRPRLSFWEKFVLVLAAICAALLLGAFHLHLDCKAVIGTTSSSAVSSNQTTSDH